MKVEKGIPIPKRRHGVRGKYPLEELEPGDSFWVKDEQDTNLCRVYARRHGIRMTRRREGDGFRIWRLE